MKKALFFLAGLIFLVSYPLESQGLLNRVRNAVNKEIASVSGGDSGKSDNEPEPSCARDDANLIVDLEKFKLDYKEFSISTKEDGSILVKDLRGDKYYIIKDGVSQGPYTEDDARVKEFTSASDVNKGNSNDWADKYPDYISKTGDKYLIKFNSKTFGPYAEINDFAISKSGGKFAAVIIEKYIVTEDQGKQMEEALENAKTDQERIEIAMKMSQHIQNQMMSGDGMSSLEPKLISNIPNVTYDPVSWEGGKMNGSVTFDDILVIAPDRIIDLQGKTVLNLNQSINNLGDLFVNSSKTKYASYKFGTLTFNDKTTLSGLFNPALKKVDGKEYLSYMYFSPGKHAIMQCSIPF